jgi:ABC-type amino acid transport substrate-binding protein
MRIPCSLLLFALLLFAGLARADSPKLKVGIFERPPFAMRDENGQWTGLAVEIWEHVSAQAGLPFEYVVTPEAEAIERAARGELDLVVGEIGLTPARERLIDFTQPYLTVPASVAVTKRSLRPSWGDLARDLLDNGFVPIMVILLASLFIFAGLLWVVERRVNAAHFGGKPWHGMGSALWFAAVTMTTVGYGDKTPRTPIGRVIVFFWMFLGVVIVSVLTGAVAASLTHLRSEHQISRAADLSRYRNGALEDSTSANVLVAIGIPVRKFPSVAEGMRALERGEITAFVGNEADLRYAVNQDFAGEMVVEPISTTHVSFAFATRPDLPQRDEINVALIDETTRPGWERQIERWIGVPTQP